MNLATTFRCLKLVATSASLLAAAALSVNRALAELPVTVLHSFATEPFAGFNNEGDLIASGSTLYGTTFDGGTNNVGAIFSVGTDGNNYTVLHSFTGGTDGSLPLSGLTLIDSTLYGTTYFGGDSSKGTLFKVNTNGSGYQVVRSFTGNQGDGTNPVGSLTSIGSTLFGVTIRGGALGGGIAFSIDANGSGFKTLHSFSGTQGDGFGPAAGLIPSGSTLYGTTQSSGALGGGTVFSINATGSDYQILHNFASGGNGNNPSVPEARLTLIGATLYGSTFDGGDSQPLGTLFSLNTDGTAYQSIHNFQALTGYGPAADLTQVGSLLFGTASTGGSQNAGLIFSINPDGTNYQIVHTFKGGAADGHVPDAGLTLVGSVLYGTTVNGGTNNHGTVFSSALPSSTLLGDLNRDNQFNALDLKAMLTAVTDLKAYKSGNYYTSDADFLAVADLNTDGKVNNADIQALLNKLKSGNGSVAAVPEPVTMQLLLAALAIVVGVRLRANYERRF